MIYQFYDFHPEIGNFREEIITGLSLKQKAIAPKFFYDQKGSELFAQICDLPEYYPTRTEISILKTYSEEISQLIDKNCLFIEYGSGNSQKIRILLDILQKPAGYMPIDISKEYMLQACEELAIIYPDLNIIPVCADYTKDLELPLIEQDINKKVIFFPGSTIGNLTPEEALELLQKSATLLNAQDGFLVGVDLKKDIDVLNAAYNDSQGVTAAFNLNLLPRINHTLNANFEIDDFKHDAFYNEEKGRIEMHLVSLKKQIVTIDNKDFYFELGETIHTENSYKYAIDEFHNLSKKAGFYPLKVWTDINQLFSVHYLIKNGQMITDN